MQHVMHDEQAEEEKSHWAAWTAGIVGGAALAAAGYAAWHFTRKQTRRERLMKKAEQALAMIRR